MPKPPAPFVLHTLYVDAKDGPVTIKELTNSHTYKVTDLAYGRENVVSPSATGLTGRMEKGAGLMVYAMSEAMKYMDAQFTNLSIKQMVETEFTFKQLFIDARKAHIDKSALGKRVGTASHAYVEQLLTALLDAQKRHLQFVVPPAPMAIDIQTDLRDSYLSIVDIYKFDKPAIVDKYRQVINRDVEVRKLIWQESMMLQHTAVSAREFFVAAVKARALRVMAIEKIVHSRKYFFSGRFDALLEFVEDFSWRGYTIQKGVYMTDYKTSNPGTDYPMGIYPEYLPQIGLYDLALTEEFPALDKRITGHLILGSSKTGVGFHPYASMQRRRNRDWGKALIPINEFMYQGEKELKGVDLYGGK